MNDKAVAVADKMEYLWSLKDKIDISKMPMEDQMEMVLAEMAYLNRIEPVLLRNVEEKDRKDGFSVIQ